MDPKRPTRRFIITLALVTLMAAYHGCGGEDPPSGPGTNNGPPNGTVDTIPPAAIVEIVCTTPGAGSLGLQWITPGDDGWIGTAAAFDIRYSKHQIDEGNWDVATPLGDPPPPEPGGSVQTCRLSGLDALTSYYVAIKTRDDASNQSALSRIASGTTLQEHHPPSAVTDLEAIAVDDTTLLLTWTAPGDDGTFGTATRYDIRWIQNNVVNNTNWNRALQVESEPDPKPAGQPESLLVSVPYATFNYGFTLISADEVPNWSELSNRCRALGMKSRIWVYPITIRRGKSANILFRSVGGPHVGMQLQEYSWETCGGPDRIYDGAPPAGIHLTTFDFIDTRTGQYFRNGFYFIVICHDGVFRGSVLVELID